MPSVTKIVVLTMSLLCGVASAKDATFCRSAIKKTFASAGTEALGDNTTFSCDNRLKTNIPGLYKLGWRVVHLSEQAYMGSMNQPGSPDSGSFTLILIEKD